MSDDVSSRRHMVQTVAVGAAALFPALANAEIDYEGVKYLGGTNKVDVNNANIRAFTQFPGMYPSAAAKILKAVPNDGYKSAGELYNAPGLTSAEKDVIKKYEGNFVFLTPKPEYVIDRLNNVRGISADGHRRVLIPSSRASLAGSLPLSATDGSGVGLKRSSATAHASCRRHSRSEGSVWPGTSEGS